MRYRLLLVIVMGVLASLLAGCSCHAGRDYPAAVIPTGEDGGPGTDHPIGNVKAVIQVAPPSIPQGDSFTTTVSFDGSMSVGMGILSYQWDIGAGRLTAGALTDPKISATFAGDGNAAVSLTVKDDLGTNAAAAVVRIALAPMALVRPEMVTEVGADLEIDGSLSVARDRQRLVFAWSATNPGAALTGADQPKLHFKSSVPGDIVVALKVTAGTLSAGTRLVVHVLPALADQRPLEATLTVTPSNPGIGENVTMTVVAPEAGPDASVDFRFGGKHKLVTGLTLSTTFPSSGNFPVVATVTSLGRYGRARAPLSVYNPSIPDDGAPPAVSISSPTEQLILTKRTDASGSVNDTDLAAYYLEARAKSATGDTPWTELSSGTANVSGVLGKVETSLLPTGDYTLRLRAVDLRGHEASTTVPISLQAPNMGQVTFTIDDVNAKFPGVPLVVRRTYNSGAGTKTDFGWNWSMSATGNGEIHTTGPVGEGWQFSGNCVFTANLDEERQHIVTIKTGLNTDYFQYAPTFAGCITGGAMFYAKFQSATQNKGQLHVEGEGDELIMLSGDNKMYRFDDLSNPVPTQIYEPKNWDLTNKDQSKLHFEKGKLTTVRDIRGNGVDVKDDEVVHTSGAKMSFTRNADKLITSIKRPDNKERFYTYNSSQELIAAKDFDGHILHYVYGPDHQLYRIIDGRGIVVFDVAYDDAGRLGQVLSDSGTNFTYDFNGQSQTETNGKGAVHKLKYDDNGQIVEEKLNDRTLKAAVYNAKGYPMTRTDSEGRTVSLEWTADGFMTKRSDSEGHSQTFGLDAFGTPSSVTDESGTTLNLTRDADGQVTNVAGPNGLSYGITRNPGTGEMASLTAGGTTTTFEHDSYGHVTNVKSGGNSYNVVTDIMGNSTGVEYTEDGHLYHVENDVDQDGVPNATRASVDGKLVSSTKVGQDEDGVYGTDNNGGRLVRDAKGQPLALVKPDGSTTSRTFYPDGRPEFETSGEGNGTHYAYDNAAHTTTAVFSNGSTTVSTADSQGRIVKAVHDGIEHTYAYDAKGNRTTENGPSGSTKYTYDGNGLVTAIDLPNGSHVANTYDKSNKLISTQTDNKPPMTMVRDARGNVTQIKSSQGFTQNQTFDAGGHLATIGAGSLPQNKLVWNGKSIVSLTDGNGHTRTHKSTTFDSVVIETLAGGKTRTSTRDPAGKTVVITGFDGKATTVEYDASQRPTSRAAADGTKVSFAYDSDNKVAVMHDATGDTSFTRDRGGNVSLVLRPDGRAVRTTYDAFGTASVRTASGNDEFVRDATGAVNLVHASGLDVAIDRTPKDGPSKWTAGGVVVDRTVSGGNTASLQVSRGGQQVWREDYTYDNDNVATSVTRKGEALAISYDEGRKLTAFGGDTYAYDGAGNITQMGGGVARAFTFDADDRLVTGGKESFTYDDAGRLTKIAGEREMTLVWDGLDRLKEAHTGGTLGNHAVTYGYEADGLMIERTEDGVKRLFAWRQDGGLPLPVEEYDATGKSLAHTTKAGNLIIRHVGDVAYVMTTDVFGNVRVVTDKDGVVVDERVYSAYGELRTGKITLDQPFGFAGEWTDPTTGLVFMRQRHYDPVTAKFLSRDPVDPRPENQVTANAYQYAGDSPTIYRDPTGGQESLLGMMISMSINIAMRAQMSPVFNILGGLISSSIAYRLTNTALAKSKIFSHMVEQYSPLPTDLIGGISVLGTVLGHGAVGGDEILAQIQRPYIGSGWAFFYFGAPFVMKDLVATMDQSGGYNAATWDADYGDFTGYLGGGVYGAQGGAAATGAWYGGFAYDANHPASYEGAFAAISGHPILVVLMLLDAVIEQAFMINQGGGATLGEILFDVAGTGLFSLEALAGGYTAQLVEINTWLAAGGFLQFAFSPNAGDSKFCAGAAGAEACYQSQAWSLTGGKSKSTQPYASVLTFFTYTFTWYQCTNAAFCSSAAPNVAPLPGMKLKPKP